MLTNKLYIGKNIYIYIYIYIYFQVFVLKVYSITDFYHIEFANIRFLTH